MKTGEYLTGGRPVKAPKSEKRPPSGSKNPVTPLPRILPDKGGPKAHIGIPGGKRPKAKAAPSGSAAVGAVAKASAAAKSSGASSAPKPFFNK